MISGSWIDLSLWTRDVHFLCSVLVTRTEQNTISNLKFSDQFAKDRKDIDTKTKFVRTLRIQRVRVHNKLFVDFFLC